MLLFVPFVFAALFITRGLEADELAARWHGVRSRDSLQFRGFAAARQHWSKSRMPPRLLGSSRCRGFSPRVAAFLDDSLTTGARGGCVIFGAACGLNRRPRCSTQAAAPRPRPEITTCPRLRGSVRRLSIGVPG